jgi:hypothetical protein
MESITEIEKGRTTQENGYYLSDPTGVMDSQPSRTKVSKYTSETEELGIELTNILVPLYLHTQLNFCC